MVARSHLGFTRVGSVDVRSRVRRPSSSTPSLSSPPIVDCVVGFDLVESTLRTATSGPEGLGSVPFDRSNAVDGPFVRSVSALFGGQTGGRLETVRVRKLAGVRSRRRVRHVKAPLSAVSHRSISGRSSVGTPVERRARPRSTTVGIAVPASVRSVAPASVSIATISSPSTGECAVCFARGEPRSTG